MKDHHSTSRGFSRPACWAGVVFAAALLGALFVPRSFAEEAQEEPPVVAAVAGNDDARDVYENQCAACHRADGLGYAGAVPPHAGNLPIMMHVEGGRDYLIAVVLYGLRGEIEAAGRTFNGIMPPKDRLSDDDVAAALNYAVTAFGNEELLPADFNPFSPGEVEQARDWQLSQDEVHERRQALDLPDVEPLDALVRQRPLARILDTPAPKRLAELHGPPAEALEEREPPAVDRDRFEALMRAEPDEAPEEIVEEPDPDEPEVEPEVEAEDPEVDPEEVDFEWEELGAQAYGQCAGCHQADGSGVPGAFPPLANHAADLANAEGGREYLIKVVLYGLQGPIEVGGQTYDTPMPPFAQLSDEQVAAVLNHVLHSWDNEEALVEETVILPDEVEALRDLGLTPTDVHDARQELELP